jgi:hypothetical protein
LLRGRGEGLGGMEPVIHLLRRPVVQNAPRPVVQLELDQIELFSRELRQIRALGQVLPDQAIGVLVAAALPGTVGVAVDLDANALAAARAAPSPCLDRGSG